ncbi:MAG: hypothetical protein HLUCCO02_03790 [Idiomarinaceae bacterium HL-53]|nr:MAG: hypothetical protein HLUCCO02_03790 [Idiomarinaceae bacterium HL-53]
MYSLSVFAWLSLVIWLFANHYLKAVASAPSFLIAANGAGLYVDSQVAMQWCRPALCTPFVVWVNVRQSNHRRVWLTLWRDQFDVVAWCRLRRITNDLNH